MAGLSRGLAVPQRRHLCTDMCWDMCVNICVDIEPEDRQVGSDWYRVFRHAYIQTCV